MYACRKMKIKMKKIFIALLAVIAVGISACKKSTPISPANAALMFVNGCIGTSPLGPAINSTKAAGDITLPYLNNSGYQATPAGSNLNLAFMVGSNEVLTSQAAQRIDADNFYSVFACGSVDKPSMIVLQDDLLKPSNGNAKIRFVNLSGDDLELSCSVNGTQLIPELGYQMATSFFQITAATANILLQDNNHPFSRVQLSNQPLLADRIYTVMFTGTSPNYSLSVINNY